MIIDASALLAILRNEDGAEKAVAHAKAGVISTVNFAEVLSKASDLGMAPAAVRRLTERLEIATLPFSARQAQLSGALRRNLRHGRISLADRACLAVGMDRDEPILTGDRKWAELGIGIGVQIVRIR